MRWSGLGDPCGSLRVFYREKRNRSGSVSVQVLEKRGRKNILVCSIGSAKEQADIHDLKERASRFIAQRTGQQGLDLHLQDEQDRFDATFKSIGDVILLGPELVLGRLFEQIGFGAVPDEMFRHLVLSRIMHPCSKLKTVRYLQEQRRTQMHVQEIYRYMDELSSTHKQQVEQISHAHSMRVLGGTLSAVFYDVTTLYFEAEQPDDLRIPGYSKDGKHNDPQVLLGLLVGAGGYPLAYDIFKGNTFEGHTMIPVIERFKQRFGAGSLVVVADAGLLSRANMDALHRAGHQFILGARLRGEKDATKQAILNNRYIQDAPQEILREDGLRLVVSYSQGRAAKDKHNRERALARLQRAVQGGKLTKANINNRGYNKFLRMQGLLEVSIDNEKLKEDARWDGLKGYLTNTTIPAQELIDNYKHLWAIEQAFRISKTDLRVRPVYHRLQRRIEAHICICFSAYQVYKELQRQLFQNQCGLSAERAIECLATVYGITIHDQTSGRSQTRILAKTQDQQLLLRTFGIDFG